MRGRPKGSKLTEEQKQKMREGRLAAKQARQNAPKLVQVGPKPILHITGEEVEGFDFWKPLRDSLRPLHQYTLCKQIEKEITDPQVWKNRGIILNILSKYVEIKSDVPPPPKKEKKERKARALMTEEQKERLRENLAKARAMRGRK